MSSVISKNVPELPKLERLDGNNYKCWSQKLLMYFEQLKIDYVLFSDPTPAVTETAATAEQTPPVISAVKSNEEAIKKYDKVNKTAKYHLLNNMTEILFDLFMIHKSAHTIWESLKKKYGADDAGKKKYVVGKWLGSQMVDGKPIMDQVHVYENLCADVVNEGMKLDDIFLANFLLERFLPSWSVYQNHLKHKKKDLSLQELVSHMRNEEANRLKDKPVIQPSNATVAANLVESGGPSNYEKFKAGHKPYQCSEKKSAEANVAVTGDVIAAMVMEANPVGNVVEWVLDTRASRHLCADRGLFAEFEEVADGKCVYMVLALLLMFLLNQEEVKDLDAQ
ncbi:uncharacterized protein LOC141600734 [Silene latifolia]|uniref:uncharacterized protein LOC141600734 n=1 Tax=Silene latifolia TaxID=37657 RepID=UPI003D77518E